MTVHNYSNTASKATLDSPLNSSANTFSVSSFTGYPSVPFFILMDRDTSSAELMEVTTVAGSTLTASRGVGGTASTSHSAGATVEHVIPAAVPQAVEQHVEAVANVHGVTGTLIGADSPGTMTNKTYEGAHVHRLSASLPASPAAGFVVTGDSSVARDGFLADNTAANTDRSAFLLKQAGTERFNVYNDGTVRVIPSGATTRAAIQVTGEIRSDDLTLTDDLTVGGDATVTGAVVAASVNAGTVTASGGIVSTNTNTLGSVTASGVIQANAAGTALTVTNTAQVGALNVVSGNVAITGTNGKLQLPNGGSGNGTAIGQVRYRLGQLERWDGAAWRGDTQAGGSTQSGFSGVNSTQNRQIYATAIANPGHPYFLLVHGQAEFNSVPGGDRWDLAVCLDDPNAASVIIIGLGNGFTRTGMGVTGELTGAHNVYFVARRTIGSGSVDITAFNQNFAVVQLASIPPSA